MKTLLTIFFMAVASLYYTISESRPAIISEPKTAININTIASIVYTETLHNTNPFEYDLITETILYKYYKNTDGNISLEEYLKKHPRHFQGEQWKYEQVIEQEKDKDSQPGWIKKNIERKNEIIKRIKWRIKGGAIRPIEHYHHTLVDSVQFKNGKKPLNLKHINRIDSMASIGEIARIDAEFLTHSFFEDNTIKKGYKAFRRSVYVK